MHISDIAGKLGEAPAQAASCPATLICRSEALHPFNVFREAGFEVDVTSEKGTFGYDEHSISDDALDPESKDAWNDSSHPLRNQLKNQLLVASEVDPSKVSYSMLAPSTAYLTALAHY